MLNFQYFCKNASTGWPLVNADLISEHSGSEPGNVKNRVATPVNTASGEQSVNYARSWYVIRATLSRARSVADSLIALNYQVYLPVRKIRETVTVNGVTDYTYHDELWSRSLLFVHCTEADMENLVRNSGIKGLTPYYNHFEQNRFGRDRYLVVPDRQMDSFVRIVDSYNQNVIVRLGEELHLARGHRVRIADGEFAGVEGIVMRIAGQRRVVVRIQGLGYVATAFIPMAFLRDAAD